MHRRAVGFVAVAAGTTALSLTVALPTGSARPAHVAAPHASTSAAVGRLAWITPASSVRMAQVSSNGDLTNYLVIGPISPKPAQGQIVASDLVSSGSLLAWDEVDQKPLSGSYGYDDSHNAVVVDHASSGSRQRIPLKGYQAPYGFVGHDLVVSNGQSVSYLRPGSDTTHHVPLPPRYPEIIAVDNAGIIVENSPRKHLKEQQFSLVSLSGHRTVLHTFAAPHGQQSPIELGWASPDGHRLILERGDHTDFGGVGPSSVAYSLSGRHASSPTRLGSVGKPSAGWRMEQTSFAGSGHTPYTVWTTAKNHAPQPFVYRFTGGHWRRLRSAPTGVVAGSRSGAVAVQPARYVQDPRIDIADYYPKPTGDAVLYDGGHHHTVKLRAAELAWLNP